MVRLGHPSGKPDGVGQLYKEVLFADSELKRIWNERPNFLRSECPLRPEWPPDVVHQRCALELSFAHKVSSSLSNVTDKSNRLNVRLLLYTDTFTYKALKTLHTRIPRSVCFLVPNDMPYKRAEMLFFIYRRLASLQHEVLCEHSSIGPTKNSPRCTSECGLL